MLYRVWCVLKCEKLYLSQCRLDDEQRKRNQQMRNIWGTVSRVKYNKLVEKKKTACLCKRKPPLQGAALKCGEGYIEVKADFPWRTHYTGKAKILSSRLICAIHGTPWADSGMRSKGMADGPPRSLEGLEQQPAMGGALISFCSKETNRRRPSYKTQIISWQIWWLIKRLPC